MLKEEKYEGETDLDTVCLKNNPSWLNVVQINFEGNLLIVQGMTHRGGNSKEVVWVYKRIKG